MEVAIEVLWQEIVFEIRCVLRYTKAKWTWARRVKSQMNTISRWPIKGAK